MIIIIIILKAQAAASIIPQSETSIEALKRRQNDVDPTVRTAAAATLEKLSPSRGVCLSCFARQGKFTDARSRRFARARRHSSAEIDQSGLLAALIVVYIEIVRPERESA